MEVSDRKRKVGATKHCAYGTCNSDSRYPDRAAMRDVFFMRFPKPGKDLEKCQRWVKACSREGFDETWVKKDTYICSLHFVDGKGPTDLHPDPIPANATKYDVQRLKKTPRRRVQRRLVLNESAHLVTEVNRSDNNDGSGQLSNRLHESESNNHDIAEILLSLSEKVHNKENIPVENEQICNEQCIAEAEVSSDIFFARKLCTTSSQTEGGSTQEMALRIQNTILKNDNENLKSKLDLSKTLEKETDVKQTINVRCDFDFSELEHDDKKSKFFTGLTYMQLLQLWNFLLPALPHLKYWNRISVKDSFRISAKNALLITLMRLHNGYTNQDIAYRFGTSAANISQIILTWIQFLYKQFLPLKNLMFADRGRIREMMPACFKKYKNLRCIIDCTEFFSQRPRNFQRQGNLFSTYKSHTTYKVLVGVAPNGSVMFISDVFEGSISDRDIVVKSGFLDFLHPGDTIMADRGFNIKDLLNDRKVDLIIPPFLMGRKNFTPQEEALTKDIAKHRIHVERSIERIKKFKLLQKTLPLSLEPVLTQIVFIVGCLVNFQEPLVR